MFTCPVNACVMERCAYQNAELELPEELIENFEIFKGVACKETWENCLSNDERSRLMSLLPASLFEDESNEAVKTINMLFSYENFFFGNPLEKFHTKLKNGSFQPDISKFMSLCQLASQKEYRLNIELYYEKLLRQILINRQQILDEAHYGSRAGAKQKSDHLYSACERNRCNERSIKFRVNKLCREHLNEIREKLGERSECYSSDDDDDDENADDYEYDSDVCKTDDSNNEHFSTSEYKAKRSDWRVTEEHLQSMVRKHRRRKLEMPNHDELDTTGITLDDIISKTELSCNYDFPDLKPKKAKKPLKMKGLHHGHPLDTSDRTLVENEHDGNKVTYFSSPNDAGNNEDLNMHIDDNSHLNQFNLKTTFPFLNIIDRPRPVSHSNFFSLLKELMCSEFERVSNLEKLEALVREWQMNEPDTTNNAWKLEYNDWVELVLPALKFLSNQSIGTSSSYEAFNPFVAFDESSQSWRWVSEEMFDNDDQLSVLYYHWMEERNSLQLDSSIAESSAVVPEARFRTDYIVQVSTPEERETFREQERQRFNNPHRSFTYRQHGYESTVGPVKGVYSRESNMMKARGHALLVRDRPACVNILTLVHDSAARLPNGQGTRADICTLLKDSQYLADDIAEAQLHTVVSGALDRLHYEKDPCVKYDGAQKVWIHRHRNRTEEEFERIHQMQRAAIRAKKLASTMKSNMRKIQQQQIKLQQQQNQVQSNVDSTVKSCPQNVPHAHKKQQHVKKQSKLCAKLSESVESSSAIVNANESVNLNKQMLNYQEVPQKQSKIQAILQLPDNTLPDVAFTERRHLVQQTSRLQAQQLLANRKPSTSGIPNLNVQQHDSTMELVKASSLMSDFQRANQQKQASGLNVCAETSAALQLISRPQISNSSKQLLSQHNLILMSQKKQDKQNSTITTSATERANPSSPWNNEYVAKLLKSNKFNTTTTLQQQVATSSTALLTSSVVNLLSNVQNINSPSVKRNVLNLNALRLLSLPPRLVNVDQSKLLKADQSMVLRSTSNNVPIVQSNISSTNMLMVSHNITNTSQLMTSRLPTLDNAQLPVLNVKPSSSLNSLMASLAPVTMKQVQQQKQIGQMQTLRPQILSTNVQPQQQAQQIRTLFLSPQQQQQLKQLQQLRSPASQPFAAQQATSPAHLPITLQGFLQLINQNQININNHAASVPTTKR